MTTVRISQLADAPGVPATSLRFYQSAGLLPAERTASGYRLYDPDAIEQMAFNGAAKHLGLPLEEIAELLAVWEADGCVDVKTNLRPRIAARLDDAERHLAELRTFTASLQRALERLDALPDRSTRCDPECGFLTPAARTAAIPASTRSLTVDGVERSFFDQTGWANLTSHVGLPSLVGPVARNAEGLLIGV